MILVLAVIVELIVLHTLDGRDVFVNPQHIVSIVDGRDPVDPDRNYAPGVHCAIGTLDGKIYTVRETCDDVRQQIR